jgi:hypothetical protein
VLSSIQILLHHYREVIEEVVLGVLVIFVQGTPSKLLNYPLPDACHGVGQCGHSMIEHRKDKKFQVI